MITYQKKKRIKEFFKRLEQPEIDYIQENYFTKQNLTPLAPVDQVILKPGEIVYFGKHKSKVLFSNGIISDIQILESNEVYLKVCHSFLNN